MLINMLNENCVNQILQDISKNDMMNTIKELVTGDNARVGGCKGEEDAAKLLKAKFENLNLISELHPFKINRPVSIGTGYLIINGENLFIKSFNGGAMIPKDLEGQLVYANLGTKEDIEACGGLNNKIALIKRGNLTFKEKVLNSYEAGAKAIIIFNTEEGISTSSLDNNIPPIPILGMSISNGEKLLNLLKKDTNLILNHNNFDININYLETSTSYNVLGTLPSNENAKNVKTIILGAHFDSASSPGASDNASGVAVMFEVARLLSKSSVKHSFNCNLQFIAFGSEELGLLGSHAFADSLEKENKASSIQAMINLDMVGVGDCINVFTANKELAKDISDLAVKYIQAGDGVYGGNYTNMTNSDHAPFDAIGIPACLVQTGPDHHFHTEYDTIEKIDENNLYNVCKVIIQMILDIDNMPERS